MLAKTLTSGAGAAPTYVDDVFGAYTYTGNGSTQTITNGIDLAGKGGLVWTKQRDAANGHVLVDTTRGTTKYLITNSTSAELIDANTVPSFLSSGYTTGSGLSGTGSTYVSWTFRKAAKFFDVVTWSGDGTTDRQVAHSLGITPGMIIVKETNQVRDWRVYHKDVVNGGRLNLTDAFNVGNYVKATSATTFTLEVANGANQSGYNYVAYLFAHDTATDGIIQCGSYTVDGSNNPVTVTLGWEPQYVMVKSASGTGGTDNWRIFDAMRGLTASGASEPILYPNLSNAENIDAGMNEVRATATGFVAKQSSANTTYIYLAIRRPNKPPTTGTQVYSGITANAPTGTVQSTGFAVDAQIITLRGGGTGSIWVDRLRGVNTTTPTSSQPNINSSSTAAEASTASYTNLWNNDGFAIAGNWSNTSTMFHNFKRAPGVFDVVCYTGTGSATTQAHNLGVVPEMIIVKKRSSTGDWHVYYGDATKAAFLNYVNVPGTSINYWNNTPPALTAFSLGLTNSENTATYVAYLFATKAGISKVGSYTGNGSSQTINAGFTTGARFILIKRTDSTGDWYVWDSTRGIIAGNDPHLSLNTTAAEVTTDDSIDPDTSGFIVNQLAATNINVTSATYIYLSFA